MKRALWGAFAAALFFPAVALADQSAGNGEWGLTALGTAAAILLPLLSVGLLWNYSIRRLKQVRSAELQRRESALAESDDRFRTLVENSPFGIVEVDTGGRILYASRVYARMLGFGREAVLGRNIIDFLRDEDRPRALEDIRRIVEELPEPGTFFNRNRTRDGRNVYFQMDWNYKRDGAGKLIGFVVVVSDITQRRRADRELRESEQRFRATFDQAAVGIAHAAHNGRFLRVNRKLCEIFGYPEEELLQKTCKEITYPEDVEATVTAVGQVAAGAAEVAKLEKRYVRKDGRIVWCNFTSAMVRDSNGRFKYFTTVIEDIGQRKRLEEQMQQHQATLARAGRINTMGVMATAIAHEINQPLMAIGNYAGGALRRLETSGSADQGLEQALERIAGLAERSGQIIERLRDFTRRREHPFRPLEINAVVNASVKMVAAQARHQKVVIESRLAPGLSRVRGDRIQLEQVVINLLMNAMEAMERTEPERRRIVLETRTADRGGVELVVSDRGCGLADAVSGTLFEPFVTTKSQGTGMGLSISRTIATAHGGGIEATPNPGGGARFHLLLPIAIEP